MIRGLFFGRNISNKPAIVGLNPAVQAFITSEVIFWSAWNTVIPIFSVLVVKEIEGVTVEHAAYAFTSYLLSRMVIELLVSHRINHFSNAQRAILDMFGMFVISLAYLGLVVSPQFNSVYAFFVMCGVGMGIAAPAKNSLFSRSMEPGTESAVWGIYDVVILLGMAIATSVGGFIASNWGFQNLLLIASALNIFGVLPYLFFIRNWRTSRKSRRSAELQQNLESVG